MTIRRTLVVAFTVVGLGSAALLAGLAFVQAQNALRAEIESNITVQAQGIATEVDKMMFERFQNAATWKTLDIMQDMQVHDVDKRLSGFLVDVRKGYGDIYLAIACLDEQDRVIASSDVPTLGSVAARTKPALPGRMAAAGVDLVFVELSPPRVEMTTAIAARYREGALGRLRLQLDWARISDVMDQAGGSDGRMAAVLDQGGRLIAASAGLLDHEHLGSNDLAAWRTPGVLLHPGGRIADADVLVASATSPGFSTYPGFGWTTLIIQPAHQALAPVRRMGLIFLALLGVVFAATLVMANWIGRRIARPITALTGYARAYARDQTLPTPPTVQGGEVGELTDAFVTMVRDIAQSQQNLVRASKLAVVGEMSSIIAHEVRTPLGILRSSAQMLRRETRISNEGLELLGFIESETERLNRLVSAMLDTARPRPAHFALVGLHAVIHDTASMLREQARRQEIVVVEHLLADHDTIECDREQIMQVILNVLMNGLQVLSSGGRIEISTRALGKYLCIELADDGPGIDPLIRDRVFEAFFFQREGGIGLGLAIVQQIVVAHGGLIEATESALGGALFRILLPYRQVHLA